jgi:ribosomal protein S18 acetylase RimI-like enzyme
VLDIRKLEKQDIPQVWRLLEHMSPYKPNTSDLEDIWKRFASQSNLLALVAVDDNRVICFALILIQHTIRGGSIAHFEGLVSDPEYRGHGVAKEIIRRLEEHAFEQNCFKIVLHCKLATETFYAKQGYEIHGSAMVKYCSP